MSVMMQRLGAGVVVVFGLAGAAQANMVLNGDFEITSAGDTLSNQTNIAFTGLMSDAVGFGAADELDIVKNTNNHLSAPSAYSGEYKLGMHRQSALPNPADALTLTLDYVTTAGESYDLSFATAGWLYSDGFATLEIGLSTAADSFGTLVYAGAATSISTWNLYSTSFSAPISADFLSVRVQAGTGKAYGFVDAFSLEGPAPSGGSAVPLPAAAPLALLGLGAMALVGRRRARG